MKPGSVLNNEFFKALIDQPKWFEKPVKFKKTLKYQWQRTNKEKPNSPMNRFSKKQNIMILNADYSLIWNFTVVNNSGTVVCKILCLNETIVPDCCCHSSTCRYVVRYANGNTAWLADFAKVFLRMTAKNNNTRLSKVLSKVKSETSIHFNNNYLRYVGILRIP